MLGATQTGVDKTRRLGQSIAAPAVLAAVAVLSAIARAPPAPAASLMEAGAETFTPTRLAALRAAGLDHAARHAGLRGRERRQCCPLVAD
ncbi:MAG TPA: hypothetical protein VFW75_05825 [Acetobacteraceae bacterium]|nr:hypothetical protein [Acetobacteraceae bacterium]